MDYTELTIDQLQTLITQVARTRTHCTKLRARCDALSFPDADPIATAARRADVAVDALAGVLRDLHARAMLPIWAGGKVPRIPKPRSRRARRD